MYLGTERGAFSVRCACERLYAVLAAPSTTMELMRSMKQGLGLVVNKRDYGVGVQNENN